MTPLRALMLSAAACAAVACQSMGPNFTAPQEPLPDRFAAAGDTPAGALVESWWTQFHDATLSRLETQAATGNLDLKVAYLRVVQSRIQVHATRAQGLPALNAAAKYTREQLGVAGLIKAQGGAAELAASPAAQGFIDSLEKPVSIWQLGFDASWELDLFGKVRRSVEAAEAQSAQTVEMQHDLQVTLQAEVAQTYFQLRAAQMQRTLTRQLIADQSDVVALTRSRQRHGLAGEAELASATAQLANLEAQLPPFDRSVAAGRHALAVLTGLPPGALDAEFEDATELPAVPADLNVGVPAALARRRPDIRAAEAALHAATAEVGVAVASLFPDISLAGSYGLRNTSTSYLFDWSSRFYAAGPAISLPIFHGGALVANVRLSRAQAVEATVTYRKTVLSALQEVEDGLTSLHDDAERSAALDRAVAEDQRALDINLDAYRRGLASYLTILTSQLQLVQARQNRVEALFAQDADVVKLYKALGGGWDGA